jgi:predicted flap endonuclease-1-like 5' DNA nuclease
VRTAFRRGRRLGALLLVAVSAWYVLLRRRSGQVRWVEPPDLGPAGLSPAQEPGAPGELPDDVLATDAGLTELPPDQDAAPAGDEARDTPDGTVVVDEVLVAEVLADTPEGSDVLVVDESDFEQAAAGEAAAGEAAAGEAAPPAAVDLGAVTDDEPTETELVAPVGLDEASTGAPAYEDEETSTRIPMPTFSEAPTMEIPAVTDNLRAVRGIGPSMERKLHGLGIISFRQLAMLDGAELERVRAELTDFRSRIEREDWAGQARELHRQKYGREPG